jgi:uncharacterized membrane protein
MANVARKYVPLVFIGAAGVASALIYGRLPASVDLAVEALLPFATTQASDPAPRWFVLTLMPVLALALWAAFRMAPTAAGRRLGQWMFRRAPAEVTAPEQFERFGKTYDTIVLAVVLLCLGIHAGMLAAALQAPQTAARIFSAVLGGSIAMMGNVMPRLRPNWVAGFRTHRIVSDSALWRYVHRKAGAAFVVSGLVTVATAVVAPRFGIVVGIASLVLALVFGAVSSMRASSTAASV